MLPSVLSFGYHTVDMRWFSRACLKSITICAIIIPFVSVTKGTDNDEGCGEWSPYSVCSMTCGVGHQTRVRSCVIDDNISNQDETHECNTMPCPRTCTDYSSWSACSKMCGHQSYRQRARLCEQMGAECMAEKQVEHETKRCPYVKCDLCSSSYCKWVGKTGYVADPEDCSSWYVCTKKSNGGFRYEHTICAADLLWNQDKLTCDTVKAETTTCVVLNGTSSHENQMGNDEPENKAPCPYKKIKRNDRKYRHRLTGDTATCDPGYHFALDLCTCMPDVVNPDLLMDDPGNTQKKDCDCLYMSFDDNIHDSGCNAAYNYAEPWKVTYIEGVADNALCLSGKQRVISELFSNWLDGSPRDALTVTMWIYMSCGKSAAKHYQGLVGTTGCAPHTRFEVYINDCSPCFAITIGDKNETFCSDSKVPCEEWIHIALVFRDGVLYFYINGEVDFQKHVTGLMANQVGALCVGHGGYLDNQFYKGYIDELYVCRRAFSDQELQTQFNLASP